MSLPEERLDHHTIYGSWDDTYGHQFLVHYPPCSDTVHVFMLGGADYGGGITCHASINADKLNTLLSSQYKDEYSLYIAVQALVTKAMYKN